jgi:lipopolysaccharide transport system permease protein
MFEAFATAWRHRTLLFRLTRRELEVRYRGSLLGLAWAALLPLLMIGIYAFVFGSVFRARWPQPASAMGQYSFAMLLFGGFIMFNIFTEAVNRSVGLMMENISYIKKVVFPLDVLPWVVTTCALLNAGIAFAVFLVLFIILYGLPPVTILLLPFVVLPIALVTLGVTYFLSSLGVFLRDLRQVIPLLTTAMLFLSPVFYSLDAVPEDFRPIIAANPLTIGIIEARQVIFWGEVPNFLEWALYTLAAFAIAILGHAWFTHTRKAFADVV